MKTSKRIPVSAAKEIGNKFDKDQVILVAFNKTIGDTWVTTWGRTVSECTQAADGGNLVKKALGWPNELTEDKAPRQKKAEAKMRNKILNEIKLEISRLDTTNYIGRNTIDLSDVNKVLEELLLETI